jgi:Guanosine polyphosphate pyrophosphohydrolases/synthetases
MADISIKFPDGKVQAFAEGTTPQDVAKSISISLAKKAVAAKYNGDLVDYLTPLKGDGDIEIVTKSDAAGLGVLRNTAAALLRIALKKDFPGIR